MFKLQNGTILNAEDNIIEDDSYAFIICELFYINLKWRKRRKILEKIIWILFSLWGLTFFSCLGAMDKHRVFTSDYRF